MFWVWLNVAKCGISLGWTETKRVAKFSLWYMSQKCCDDCKVHYKLAMGGAPQGAMRVASQIWQVVFASQTFQVFCLAFRKKAQYVVVMKILPNFHRVVILRQMHKCWGLHERHFKNMLKSVPFVSWKTLIFLKNQIGLHICSMCWFVDVAKWNNLIIIGYHQHGTP